MTRRARPGVAPGRGVGSVQFVAVLAFLALTAAACGATLQTLPAGPGAPAADARPAFDAAVAACRRVTSMSAELSVRGIAGGQRLRGRVLAGLAAPASVVLDAAAPFGASLFIYAAREGEATLLLPRDRRVLERGDPAAVLEAVTGVPLDAAALRQTLTGCAPDPGGSGRSYGTDWRAIPLAGGDAFVRRQGASPWRLVAVVQHGGGGGSPAWRADYSDFADDLPRRVRLSGGDAGRRFDLQLALSQVELNPVLDAKVFTLAVPASMAPITIEELRRSGPMAEATP